MDDSKLKAELTRFIKSGKSEDEIIEFIRTIFSTSNRLDIDILGFLLNLCLLTSDQSNHRNFGKNDDSFKDSEPEIIDQDSSEPSIPYSADDELGSEEILIFPCHETFEECHPDPLIHYHPDHVRNAFRLVVAYPKLCEYILTSIFRVLATKINCDLLDSSPSTSEHHGNDCDNDCVDTVNEEADLPKKSTLIDCYNTIASLIKKLRKICSIEKRNCKILARTNIISLLLKNIKYLIVVQPEYQHIYLEPLFKFVLVLVDYKMTESHLRKIFDLIKDENTNLKIILENLENLLEYQSRMTRNIQPIQSINFPTASMTAEEIRQDTYITNSWHWKLRSRVIEHKRKRERQREDQDLNSNAASPENKSQQVPAAPSWLECSLMTPLSNIYPLVHDGRLKLSCSMWLSVCGNLFIIENTDNKKTRSTNDFTNLNWHHHRGHWVKLSSRKKLADRYQDSSKSTRRRRRTSAFTRRRLANDKEDEEKEELEEKSRKHQQEVNQVSIGSNRYKLFKSPKTFSPHLSTINSSTDKPQEEAEKQNQSKSICNALLAHENIHLISFAVDSSTIELWLNVKNMMFKARVCQVARDGQTHLLDHKSFPSHLKARGNWSNVMICIEEEKHSTGSGYKILNLRVIVNATSEERVRLTYNLNSSDLTNFACLIGCERSAFGYVWKLSQINIYKNVPDSNMLLYILGKGPDLWSFTNFQQQATIKLPDLVNRFPRFVSDQRALLRYGMINENHILDWLTRNIVVSYVAQQPEHFLDYSPRLASPSLMNSEPSNISNSADRFIQARTLNFSRSIKLNVNDGFGTALVGSEGIESALICFADVVRRTKSSGDVQSLAFSVLLKLSQTNHYHLSKFLDELNGLRLAQFILEHPLCIISKKLLNVYFDYCVIEYDKYRVIKSPKLIYQLLSSWRAWHKDLHVAKSLYRKLKKLIRLPTSFSDHDLVPHHVIHNIKMLNEAGGKDMLLGILKDSLALANQGELVINHDIIKLVVDLIWQLIRNPPGLDVLLDIMEYLIFLHHDVKAYVEVETLRLNFLRKLDIEYLTTVTSNINRNRFGSTSSESDQSSADFDDQISENSYKLSDNEEEEESCRYYLKDGELVNESRYDTSRDKDIWRRSTSKSHLEQFYHRTDDFTISSDRNEECSNQDYTIASLTNILSSIIKLASDSHQDIIRESLSKSIIDVRKLVILANNDASLVRESVLQLFLYCIQCCYQFEVETVISKHEREGRNYNIHLPITLMGYQLTRYPTTLKMINMCYQAIISNNIQHSGELDISKFDFDSESKNINLMLNTFILTIRLMTRLQNPREIIDTLRFVCSFIIRLGKSEQYKSKLTFLIKEHLMDSLLRMYFSYAELYMGRLNRGPTIDSPSQDNLSGEILAELEQELDKVLLFITRTIIQNASTTEAMASLEDLIIRLDLISGYLPLEFHYLLRDRQVIVLSAALRYCKHYEQNAKENSCVGRLDYYLTSFFGSNDRHTFSNNLSNTNLQLNTLVQDIMSDNTVSYDRDLTNGRSRSSTITSSSDVRITNGYHEDQDTSSRQNGVLNDDDLISGSELGRSNVITRFLATFRLVSQFILTRNDKIIPSPLERSFVMKYLHILSMYLEESLTMRLPLAGKKKPSSDCQWSLILPKLERKLYSHFARIVVYLLTPDTDSTNIDERKYYVAKILDMFSAENLIEFMNNDGAKLDKRIARLLACVRDLRETGGSTDNPDSSGDEQDAELFADEIETKLKSFIELLEDNLGYQSKQGRKKSISVALLKLYDGDTEKLERRHLTHWLAKLAQMRESKKGKMNSILAEEKTSFSASGEDFVEELLDQASEITKEVVKDKNEQRKIDLDELKQTNVYNYQIRQQWLSLVYGHAHDRALWYMQEYYPESWELNPVEGPSRCRKRLKPCRLTLDARFLRQPHQSKSKFNANGISEEAPKLDTPLLEVCSGEWNNQWSNPHPLCSMIINNGQSLEPNELRTRMYTTDRIIFYCDCTFVRPNVVCKGEISVAKWCIHFIEKRDNIGSMFLNRSRQDRSSRGTFNMAVDELADDQAYSSATSQKTVSQLNGTDTVRSGLASGVVEDLWYDEIVEIWDRRYELRDIGLEIFLTNNMNYLISFETTQDREDFKQNLLKEQHKMINLQRSSSSTSLMRLTQFWREGRLTNFDYLTCLNKYAGRSFNDLMQYPIFPFVLSNYTSKTLDLNSESNYRKLDRPMAIQNEERKAIFIRNFELSQNCNLTAGTCGLTKPYHYSNHYSNSATVLHFLVRLPPFTQMLIQYQDNNFDQPDRTFHSLANSWQLITNDSNTDFKELIPEFFFLPEMFLNQANLDLGVKQNNELVDDVQLPDWCPQKDARLFTLIHRQALESAYVSENLHHWIDLIFGYKQTGRAAIESLNVFHPATYYGEFHLYNHITSPHEDANTITTAINNIYAKSQGRSSFYASTWTNRRSDDESSASGLMHGKLEHSMIEQAALETMIRTYGQMPRQLFNQPVKQRSTTTFTPQANELRLEQRLQSQGIRRTLRREPLAQVKGLRWGSYVGSPEEDDIIALKHKCLVPDESRKTSRRRRIPDAASDTHKFQLCLLTNGDVVIHKSNTSLILDYRADRKSPGMLQLPMILPLRYNRRASLSNVARMNLFSNMIISRQQFSFLEPAHSPPNQLQGSIGLKPIAGSRTKFAPDTLSLISWFYLDGTIRIRNPATSDHSPSVPLVQANTIVDSMSTCASVPQLNLLLVGYNSGSICAHIITTSFETCPVVDQSQASVSSHALAMAALSSNSAAPGAVHFLHHIGNDTGEYGSLGHGMISDSPVQSVVSLAGKTMQSVRTMNKTSRWLYCHKKRVNAIEINVSFGILVTGSDDGTSVIWDLNSLTYVRTIDYKAKSTKKIEVELDSMASMNGARLSPSSCMAYQRSMDFLCNCDNRISYMNDTMPEHMRTEPHCCICASGVSLIAVSDTLGDIATVKHLSNRLASTFDLDEAQSDDSNDSDSSCSTSAKSSSDSSDCLSSVLYIHSINGNLIGFVCCHTKITAICYSNAPEGISVNVVVVGLADGLVRMYSSWDLSRVKEFRVSGFSSPINSLLYTRDNQLLYVTYEDGQLLVLRSKKRGSIVVPKEWYL